MNDIATTLTLLADQLQASPKRRLLCISTTANIHNPEIYIGSMRETESTMAGNIIVTNGAHLPTIIRRFDGLVDTFLVDGEKKRDVVPLDELCQPLIRKSKMVVYKPNDFTVDAVDMHIASRLHNLRKARVAVFGAGNIGSKLALRLAERGAVVRLWGRNYAAVNTIVEGLRAISRGEGDITACQDKQLAADDARLVIGTTAGIPVINGKVMEIMQPDSVILDVGNGTVDLRDMPVAVQRNITVSCPSSYGGYRAFIEHWLYVERQQALPERRTLAPGCTIILAGVLGERGEVVVRDTLTPSAIVGIADGQGGLLEGEEKQAVLTDLLPYRHESFGRFLNTLFV